MQKPVDIQATDINSGSITIKWGDVNVDVPYTFIVVCSRVTDSSNEEVHRYEVDGTECKCTDLEPNTCYEFTVSSYHNGQQSEGCSVRAETTGKNTFLKIIFMMAIILYTTRRR